MTPGNVYIVHLSPLLLTGMYDSATGQMQYIVHCTLGSRTIGDIPVFCFC